MASRKSSRRDPALRLRLISGFVLGPIAALLAIVGGWPFALWVGVFGVAMAFEWTRMSDPKAGAAAYALSAGGMIAGIGLAATGFWPVALAAPAVAAGVGALERLSRGEAWRALFGGIYLSWASIALLWLRSGEHGGLDTLLYVFAVVWAVDIGAYLVGTWVGGPKLLPKASPNKTWTGLAAALVLGLAAGLGLASLLGRSDVPLTALALALALAAVGGDLLMSLMKRRFGVKDTGHIIPGHGGVLDRVDALMLASLVAALALIWGG